MKRKRVASLFLIFGISCFIIGVTIPLVFRPSKTTPVSTSTQFSSTTEMNSISTSSESTTKTTPISLDSTTKRTTTETLLPTTPNPTQTTQTTLPTTTTTSTTTTTLTTTPTTIISTTTTSTSTTTSTTTTSPTTTLVTTTIANSTQTSTTTTSKTTITTTITTTTPTTPTTTTTSITTTTTTTATTTTTPGFVRPEGQYDFDLWPKGGKIQDRHYADSYVTYENAQSQKMNVRQSNQDCIFFESTEVLYKFRIKVPDEKLYVREKREDPNPEINERAWKDGSLSDKGIVWEFDQKTSDGQTWYYIKSESNWFWKAYINGNERPLKIKPNVEDIKRDRYQFIITECK